MANPFDLAGRVALVTGASRGLGEHFARVLASAGADIAITSRTPESLSRPKDELSALGRRVEYADMPAIRSIIRQAGKSNNRMSAFILGVVDSAAFRMAKAADARPLITDAGEAKRSNANSR